MTEETIIASRRGRVAFLSLNRPAARNALNASMMGQLAAALEANDGDGDVSCTVIAGSAGVFAAGADVREMQALGYPDTYLTDLYRDIDRVAAARKPLIAAVAGAALGGGCELALACDIVVAADTARFGLPEITLGIMPGLGGTQRLVRAVGKAAAMDMILTGRTVDAAEAARIGLVSRVVTPDGLAAAAEEIGVRIAGFSLAAVMMAKESLGRAFESSLAEGTRFERRLFQAMFATLDQKEGMAAFLAKRPPEFRNR